MISDFYTALILILRAGVCNTVTYGINRSKTDDTYLTVQHIDYFDRNTFMDAGTCYYNKIEFQIRCHSKTRTKALNVSESVKKLLNQNYFTIVNHRIVKMELRQRITIPQGIDDGYTYVLDYVYMLGTKG